MSLLIKEEYAQMAAKENFYWWHLGRRAILNSVLRRYFKGIKNSILDVGCGAGSNILFLRNFGSVVGLDYSKDALQFCENKGFKELVLGQAERIPYSNDSFDLVTAFDVLEHLEDDDIALREMKRVSKNLVMVAVPALPFLWNPQDVYLDHKRRYFQKELIKKFNEVGLEILETSYFVLPSVPVIIARHLLEKILKLDKKPHSFDIILPKLLNTFFINLLKTERLLLKFISFPFGSSLYVIAQKSNH